MLMTRNNFKRIHVTGGAGSGKSTVAKHLASRFGVPHFELDAEVGEAADFGILLSSASWVSDGIFVYGMSPVLARVDLIVWLDLPRHVALRRIVIRHARRSLRGTNPHRGIRKLIRFLRSQRRYYTAPAREPTGPTDWDAISRAATVALLEPWVAKVVRLRSPRAVDRWLAEVDA